MICWGYWYKHFAFVLPLSYINSILFHRLILFIHVTESISGLRGMRDSHQPLSQLSSIVPVQRRDSARIEIWPST